MNHASLPTENLQMLFPFYDTHTYKNRTKLWKQIKILFFFIWVLHLYLYYVSAFSGGEEWKIVADRLGFKDACIRFFDNRFRNPVELILNVCGLNVGQLYDVLVECEFPLLADLL